MKYKNPEIVETISFDGTLGGGPPPETELKGYG